MRRWFWSWFPHRHDFIEHLSPTLPPGSFMAGYTPFLRVCQRCGMEWHGWLMPASGVTLLPGETLTLPFTGLQNPWERERFTGDR